MRPLRCAQAVDSRNEGFSALGRVVGSRVSCFKCTRHRRGKASTSERKGEYAKLVRYQIDQAASKAKAEHLDKGIELVGRKGVLR